jgi:hypothetical protein
MRGFQGLQLLEQTIVLRVWNLRRIQGVVKTAMVVKLRVQGLDLRWQRLRL